MRFCAFFLALIMAAGTVAPTPASPQTVGLAFQPDGTRYFIDVGAFQAFSCYMMLSSDIEITTVTVRIETPPGIAFVGAEPYECGDCNVTYDSQSQTVNIDFLACHSASEPLAVAELMFLNLDHVWAEDLICIAEGDADYLSCDQQPGTLQFNSDYACGREPAPRCLYVNWLEPCGLPSGTGSWGRMKARHSQSAG